MRIGIALAALSLGGCTLATMEGFDTRYPLEHPVGYVLANGNGEVIGAIETNGLDKRRLIVPTCAAERRAALAAMITLGLFRDPGDLD